MNKVEKVEKYVDKCGRVTIPSKARKQVGIVDDISITLVGNEIHVTKFMQPCCICGEDATETYKDKRICKACKKDLVKLTVKV